MAEEIDVGMKCIKYMLFVANFMFVMIGFLLISIGSTIKAIYGDFEGFMAEHYFSPATLAVAIGIIIFFVALFGCVGAIKQSTCLINMFALFLTVILILEIAASIAAYAMRSEIDSTIRKNMRKAMVNYETEDGYYDTQLWDFTQERLHCCGIDGPDDWYSRFPTTSAAAEILIHMIPVEGDASTAPTETSTPLPLWGGPPTCCRRHHDETPAYCEKKDVYKDGCLDDLSYIVSECALLLGCGALAISFIQILGIIFAHMLAKAIRRIKTQDLVDSEQSRQRAYEQLARGKQDEPSPVMYTTPSFSEA